MLLYQLLANLAAAPAKAVLMLIQHLLYEVYQHYRLALALGALAHPLRRHLGHGADILTPNIDALLALGGPFSKVRGNHTYHLYHPASLGAGIETPSTSLFPPRIGLDRNRSMAGPLFDSPQVNRVYSLLDSCSATQRSQPPEDGLKYLLGGFETHAFMPALELTLELWEAFLQGRHTAVPDWNLDGDRGFAWPTWEWIPPTPNPPFKFSC